MWFKIILPERDQRRRRNENFLLFDAFFLYYLVLEISEACKLKYDALYMFLDIDLIALKFWNLSTQNE